MSTIVHTDAAPAAIGPYAQAVIADNLVFTSGQIAIDPASGLLDGDTVALQTDRVCRNLREVLSAAGASLESVVKTTCFLTDMGAFAAFNEVYARYFTQKPARSCVAVSALPKGALVEIEVVARKP